VHSHLAGEVRRREDAATCRFLRRTCCLEHSTAELADHTVGSDDAHRLAGLKRRSGGLTVSSAVAGSVLRTTVARLVAPTVSRAGGRMHERARTRTPAGLLPAGVLACVRGASRAGYFTLSP